MNKVAEPNIGSAITSGLNEAVNVISKRNDAMITEDANKKVKELLNKPVDSNGFSLLNYENTTLTFSIGICYHCNRNAIYVYCKKRDQERDTLGSYNDRK